MPRVTIKELQDEIEVLKVGVVSGIRRYREAETNLTNAKKDLEIFEKDQSHLEEAKLGLFKCNNNIVHLWNQVCGEYEVGHGIIPTPIPEEERKNPRDALLEMKGMLEGFVHSVLEKDPKTHTSSYDQGVYTR